MNNPSPMAAAHSGAALEVGTTLALTMELFISNFGRFLVLALLPLLPLLYIAWATWSGSWSEAQRHFTSGVLALLFSPIANAAILYGAILQMRGETFTVGRALRVIVPRLPAIFGITISVSLAMAIAAIIFILPAFIVMCILYVTIPVCVVEERGVIGSMDRSGVLTRGYRWPIFGLFLIVTIIPMVLSELIASVFGMMGGAAISGLFSFAWQVVSTAFDGVLLAVIYHNLRLAKEGVDVIDIASVSAIANVFD